MIRFILLALFLLGAVGAAWAMATALGRARWDEGTRGLRERLRAARRRGAVAPYDESDLAGLPAPVAAYFRATLRPGQPLIALTRVRHAGRIDMGTQAPAWRPFVSDQLVVADRPGFDWDARVAMVPLVAAHVHDAYVDGTGTLRASALGLVPIVHAEGTPELAYGELLRHLAEAPWSPTNLLPRRGVTWEAIDATSARATLVDGTTRVTLAFEFDDAHRVVRVLADARPRTVGTTTVPTPWEGVYTRHEERNGMLVPLDAEVTWLLPEGRRPYWRGRIVRLDHEFEGDD